MDYSHVFWRIFSGMTFLFFYFFPSLIAWRLKCKSAWRIFLLNLFLGWTLLGWIGAVIWAANERFGGNFRKREATTDGKP
jgi:hypothetical protein